MRFLLVIMTLICGSAYAMEDDLSQEAYDLSSIEYNHRRTQRNPLNMVRQLKKGYKQWAKFTVKASSAHNWITNRLMQLFYAYMRPRLVYQQLQAEPLENEWQIIPDDNEQ